MLTALTVRQLAVVEDLSLTFKSGMTSLTGETGAGKSILVDALGLVLGDRADSNMVRHGSERAEIEASFDISNNIALQQWLKEQELDDDDQCHLRRTISRDGRSKAYINARQVPLSQLRNISELSIDIHGQHEHQSLLRPETQRELLDIVANNKNSVKALKTAYAEWLQIQQQLAAIRQQSEQQQARQELLNYQISELEPLNLTDSSIEQLLQEQQQLAHAAQLFHTTESTLHHLFDQDQGAAYDLIGAALTELEKLQQYEPRFTEIIETLNSAAINLDETATSLRHYLDSADLDPSRLEAVEAQLSVLHDLARKHHVEIETLPSHYQALCDELNSLSESQQNQAELAQQLKVQEKRCLELCAEIRANRQQYAKPLAETITQSIQQLAIPAGRIEFVIRPFEEGKFSDHGADHIQLLVSTNPGQPAGELAKIASGGELARISLAIQVVTAGKRSVPTLIFDEVDVGIGGGVAEIVGQHLKLLASTQQVICITHLPQVAAQAHQQLQVTKILGKDKTHTEISELNREQRIEEIARMLGGMNLTQKTRSHAEEMLDQGQS
ncbi:DNA repair protein RecN [Methylophaga sp.]|uniref:DNA repair protein RecN n=1 Tax=Methylophaga sp. TaxID=2024840 RepID=UPI00271646D0|nr:DNA repair protein RecN [Methylophaga sp.]MDO8826218.1 DNA repair protein RecN [Methylophaga sp.]